MINPNFSLNLPEFDLEAYEIATERLNLPPTEAFELAVRVSERDSSEFIPIDDLNLSGGENNE